MLVLDSSATIAWVLADERNLGPELLARLAATETAMVPMHWLLEVTNALSVAVKRKRLDPGDPGQLLARIRHQAIEIDPETIARCWHDIPALADAHGLTTYDAAYLELALRLGAPLATLDEDLAQAAHAAGVEIFS